MTASTATRNDNQKGTVYGEFEREGGDRDGRRHGHRQGDGLGDGEGWSVSVRRIASLTAVV
jgi:hypothetical protein